MGKLAVYKYVAMMFLVAQIVVSAFTITALFGGDSNPIGNTSRAMLVYILPLLIIYSFFQKYLVLSEIFQRYLVPEDFLRQVFCGGQFLSLLL